MAEVLGLIGVIASLLGLILVVIGFFYNRRANRALMEKFQRDLKATRPRTDDAPRDARQR